MAEGVHVRTFGHSTAFTVPAFKNRGHVSTVIKWSMSPLGNSISACLTCYYCFETSMSNHIKLMSPSLCCSLRCCCRSKRRREMVWPDAKGDADPDCLQQQCRHQQQYDLGGQRRFCQQCWGLHRHRRHHHHRRHRDTNGSTLAMDSCYQLLRL